MLLKYKFESYIDYYLLKINIITFKQLTTMKLFIFVSSEIEDNLTQVCVFAHTIKSATRLVTKKFNEWGYKGKPQKLGIL